MTNYHLHNRPDREITTQQEIESVLKKGKFCIISMCRNNEPYIVTLSYGYDPEKNSLYFHSAKKGLKLDFLTENKNVCATIIEDRGYITGECGHAFKSVVFWGEMVKVGDPGEKKHGMNVLLHQLEKVDAIIKEKLEKSVMALDRMEILRLDIKQVHGKTGK